MPESGPHPTGVCEAAQRCSQASARGFRDGLILAREAATTVVRRRALTLVLLALSAISFISIGALNDRYAWTLESRYDTPQPRRVGAPSGFGEKWLARYRASIISEALWQPAISFAHPSVRSASFMAWVGAPVLAFIARENREGVALLALLWALMLVLYAFFLVGILGCVRDAGQPLRLSSWLRYWRRHYAPTLAVLLVMLSLFPVVMMMIGTVVAVIGSAPPYCR